MPELRRAAECPDGAAPRQRARPRADAEAPTGSLTPGALLRLQRLAGNGAVGQMLGRLPDRARVQRTAINPAAFFGGARADNDPVAAIAGNAMSGFRGKNVGGTVWHTKLTWGALHTPGNVGGVQMNPEGSSVAGVIGPDHPYGSQPASLTAADNNHKAAQLRGGTPHVAAHIVNDQLGGPGEAQNLFAFPGTANTIMESQVEGNMKAAVAAGNYIYYSAQVNHPAAGPATSITMSWNGLDAAGNDIGGGQQNAIIGANNASANVGIVALGAAAPTALPGLRHPSHTNTVLSAPWGPFQMPDPKNAVAMSVFLDTTEFPAVGNTDAFKRFLTTYRNSSVMLEMMFSPDFTSPGFLRLMARALKRSDQITIKPRRGITPALLAALKSGTTSQQKSAFIDIVQSGDGNKAIDVLAPMLATQARSTARSRM